MLTKEHRELVNKIDKACNSQLKEYDMDQVVLFVRSTTEELRYLQNGKVQELDACRDILNDETIIEDSKKYCFFGLVNKSNTKVKSITTGEIYDLSCATCPVEIYDTDKESMPVVTIDGQKRPFVQGDFCGNKIFEDNFSYDFPSNSELTDFIDITQNLKECGRNVYGRTLQNFEDRYNNAMHEKYLNEKLSAMTQKNRNEKLATFPFKDEEKLEHRRTVIKDTEKEREF